MTTMIYPSGGASAEEAFFRRLRHATGHPASDTPKSLKL
jgi:hypothetical protein